jgi:hypothetical protein
MAHFITDNIAGSQNIADFAVVNPTSSQPNHPLGTIVRAVDPAIGEGEFIYLKGVASTVVGSIVEYDTTFQSGLSTIAVEEPRPLAVAMSANVAATTYGWYQISGEAVMVKSSAVSFAAGAIVGSGAGLAIVPVTALIMQGALVAVVASAASGAGTSVRVMINRPLGTDKVVEA